MPSLTPIQQLESDLADTPLSLEMLFRQWMVERLKAWPEIPAGLVPHIKEGLGNSLAESFTIRVTADGSNNDEDTQAMNRAAVACSVIVLFDQKAVTLASFKAVSSIISRALRGLVFDTCFRDNAGLIGSPDFYWQPNNGGTETDVVVQDSPFWDTPTGRTYNSAEFRFVSYFFKSAKPGKFSVYPAPITSA